MFGSGQDWTPLLEGTLASRARETALEIAKRLRDAPRTPLEPLDKAAAASLASGDAGTSVLFAELAACGYDDFAEHASRVLNRAIEAVPETPMPWGFYTGFSGVGWAAEHVLRRLSIAEEYDANEAVDGALLDVVQSSPWSGPFDLVDGLVGIGVYALERLPRGSSEACLLGVLDRLNELAIRVPEGIAWCDPGSGPDAPLDVGIAHGAAGVVAFLAYASRVASARERALFLLESAVRWLLAQRLLPGDGAGDSRFPYKASAAERTPARTAWCYGDPGIAAALLAAARAVDQPGWQREAMDVARAAADRPLDRTGVTDAGLCHGAAGLGHVFNRLYQATGDAALGQAARMWLARALQEPVSDASLLTGSTGVALALASATSNVAPEWDGMLLLSGRACAP
jgi:lantibiotic modifying enzyme